MLVLTRKAKESIVINGNIQVTVIEVRGNRVKLGIVAPASVPVMREEVAFEVRNRREPAPLTERPMSAVIG